MAPGLGEINRKKRDVTHMTNPSLLILPGDGIGPEVMGEVRKVIDWFGAKRDMPFDVSEDLVGGSAYDAHGTPLTDETMAKAQEVDAVLLGAVGGPKYDALDFSVLVSTKPIRTKVVKITLLALTAAINNEKFVRGILDVLLV